MIARGSVYNDMLPGIVLPCTYYISTFKKVTFYLHYLIPSDLARVKHKFKRAVISTDKATQGELI